MNYRRYATRYCRGSNTYNSVSPEGAIVNLHRSAFITGSASASLIAATRSPAWADADHVNAGIIGAVSDAPIFIAQTLGYFKEQNLDVEFQSFNSAALMTAPLSTGELDCGAGGPSAGLYNAVARGIEVKVVADKATTAPGYGFNPLMIRKPLIDSGQVKSPRDLKGLTIANVTTGDSSEPTITAALKKGGLTWNDVKHTHLSFPDQVVAMKNGSIDGSILTEPNATRAVEADIAVRFMPSDTFYPNQQIAALLYGGPFITKRADVAKRFMVAYLKGLRYYYGALKDGHYAGPNAASVTKILQENTIVKDPHLYAVMVPNAVNPDGNLNLKSMAYDLSVWRQLGEVTTNVTVEQVIDLTFLDAAIKALGKYRR
jgi:NitT/TauT family transport system substrate-binding protein